MELSLRWSSLSVPYVLSSEGTFFSNYFDVKKTTLPITCFAYQGYTFVQIIPNDPHSSCKFGRL